MQLRIHILGARRTGKTTLHNELAAALKTRRGDFVISELADASPIPSAQHDGSLYLLMGLDIVDKPAAAQAQTDENLRSQLAAAGIAYRVIYGHGPVRLANALRAVDEQLDPQRQDANSATPWVWTCEKCSDPACEHRLFSRLTERSGEL